MLFQLCDRVDTVIFKGTATLNDFHYESEKWIVNDNAIALLPCNLTQNAIAQSMVIALSEPEIMRLGKGRRAIAWQPRELTPDSEVIFLPGRLWIERFPWRERPPESYHKGTYRGSEEARVLGEIEFK